MEQHGATVMRFTTVEEPRDSDPQRCSAPPLLRRLLVAVGVMALFAVIIFGIVLWVSFFESRSVDIRYIIPNDYHGALKIVGDGDDAGRYRFEAGRHVYHFPQTGVLHVRTTWPINTWHRLTAEYENGATIYWVEPPPPNNEAVRVVELGGEGVGSGLTAYWDVVGNKEQVERWRAMWEGGGSSAHDGWIEMVKKLKGK
jgi:hypothetical protein